MTFDEFLKQYKGKYLDFDGSYGNQCFDLFQYYNKEVIGGGFVSGVGAKDIWNTYPKNLYTPIRNLPNNKPEKGDVVIWGGGYNGGVGHVAIATGRGDINLFEAFAQNDPLGSPSVLRKYSYDHVIGWLRPIPHVDYEALKAELAQTRADLIEMRASRNKWKTEAVKLQEEVKELREHIEDYKAEITEQDGVIVSALTENKKLKEQIEEYKKKKQISLSDFSKQELLKALFS